MEKTLKEQRDGLRRNGIRLAAIGELHRLPARLRSLLEDIQEDSTGGDGDNAATMGTGGVTAGTRSDENGVVHNGAPAETISVSGAGARATTTPGATYLNVGGVNESRPRTAGDGAGVVAGRNGGVAYSTPRPKTMTLCLAVSYGGRAEVAAAARELAAEAAAGRLDPGDIGEDALGRRLSTARLGIPDPDLVVRTSGESRLSNLLLWQAAYSELCVVSKAWPEFRRSDLVEAFRCGYE